MTGLYHAHSGLRYLVLLLATGQWRRYVPTSWDTFVHAGQDMLSYLAFVVPPAVEGMPFNAVQQLSYAFVILILTPLVILTGAFQSPAIANYFSKITRMLGGRQVIRTIHFWCLVGYVAFIAVHVLMVILHGYGHETSKMVFGDTSYPIAGGVIFTAGLVLVLVLHVVATRWSLKDGRAVERLQGISWQRVTVEGSANHVRYNKGLVSKIINANNGLNVGAGPGKLYDQKKYDTPFLRDFMLDRGLVCDVSETTTPWSRAEEMHDKACKAFYDTMERIGKVAHLRLNRPDAYNSMTREFWTELPTAVRAADAAAFPESAPRHCP